MKKAAKQAEKQTKTAVGGVVRGISWASLDNEVVAEILATVGGGIAKKITEYVTYKVLVKVITDPTIDLEITIGGTKYKKKQFLDWLAEQDL